MPYRRLAPCLVFGLVLLTACSQQPAEEPAAEAPVAETPAPVDESAATPEDIAESPELNVDEQGRMARGYDVVAYHHQGAAVQGDAAFSHNWQGADWLFANAENRDVFAAEPERYAPSNGGYCTFGVVLKKKLDVDPEIFLVENEELYLFLNPEVQERFLSDKSGNLELVTAHWPEIADKHPDELASEG